MGESFATEPYEYGYMKIKKSLDFLKIHHLNPCYATTLSK
jgi:hypothetical protein